MARREFIGGCYDCGKMLPKGQGKFATRGARGEKRRMVCKDTAECDHRRAMWHTQGPLASSVATVLEKARIRAMGDER